MTVATPPKKRRGINRRNKDAGSFILLAKKHPDKVICRLSQKHRPYVMIGGVKHLTLRSALAAL